MCNNRFRNGADVVADGHIDLNLIHEFNAKPIQCKTVLERVFLLSTIYKGVGTNLELGG